MADYYDLNANVFFGSTVNVHLTELWTKFISEVPSGGRILDAGCGSGRDTAFFLGQGFLVDAFDASREMVRLATAHTGVAVREGRLQDLAAAEFYDGVWCCAAALHVPDAELGDVLVRLHRALRPGGVCYLSFKLGEGERDDGGRRFTDLTEALLERRLRELAGVKVLTIWRTPDARAGREREWWVNSLSQVAK